MKRLISLALAATLLGSTAASAQGWGGHHSHGGHGWSHHGYYRGHDNSGVAIGLGIFALGALAIAASQNAHRDEAPAYEDRYGPPPSAYDNGPRGYENDAPPPPDNYDSDDGE